MGLLTLIMKIIVFAVNIILWAAGILLIVFGSLAVGNPDQMISILNNIPGVSNVSAIINVYPLFEGVAIFMIVLGSIIFLFGFVGCHGAFRMHKRSLMNYWILLIVGFLTEVALIIYAAVFTDTTTTYIQTSLLDSLNSSFYPVGINSSNYLIYDSTNAPAFGWEQLQAQSQCCGAYGPGDYSTSVAWKAVANGYILPPTCCAALPKYPAGTNITNTNQFKNYPNCVYMNNSDDYYSTGCYNNVLYMVYQFDLIAIITSSCLMGAQFLALIFTVHSWHRLVREEGGF